MAPHGINVNVVCGGFIDTDSMKIHPDYKLISKEIAARTPVGRLGTPEDLAGIVAFYVVLNRIGYAGQTLVADGGFSLTL